MADDRKTNSWSIDTMQRKVEENVKGLIGFVKKFDTPVTFEDIYQMCDLVREVQAFELCLIEEIERLRNNQK